ncbi:blood vessel epicardial substance-like [Galendromus occidentalis]|uniref:Blood vessel epicardial substance-like n=1 Tax=Galendromus occidentalis TaxID=34638 RepID=A0AAJ6QQ55_9ACAR|nr:blood vessel epicardial substance-like [Galendromus occidentalis]
MGLLESLPCQAGWLPTNHLLFHFANVCLFLSYCVPPGLKGLLFLRIVLFFACLFFALWGWLVLCALDTFMWNAIFTIMNLVQSYLAYNMIPKTTRLPKAVENLYSKLLEPLRISRQEFEFVYNAAREVMYLESGQVFDVNHLGDNISLVIRGRLGILSRDGKPITEYFQFEFVDPAKCFGREVDQNVEFTAIDTETVVLIWRRPDLQNVFRRDPHLKMVFDCLAARQLLPVRSKAKSEANNFPMVEAPPNDGRISVNEGES